MFNPGGTKRVLSFGGLGNVPNTRANKNKETDEFLSRRRQEIEKLNETYHRLNHDINILVLSKESQEDENHLEKVKHENDIYKLKEELRYQTSLYGTSIERLVDQRDELTEMRDQMIDDNEKIRKDIGHNNTAAQQEREHLIREVAQLEARKLALDSYLTQSQVNQGNLSAIPTVSPDQTSHNVRFASPQTPEYVNADGSSPQLGAAQSSTPHVTGT